MRSYLLTTDDARWTSILEESPHDFYHLPAYTRLAAAQEGGEGRALYTEDSGARMLLPLVIRQIPSGGRDVTSPYGYPGPLVIGSNDPSFLSDALADGTEILRSEGIVSLFARLHPLLNPDLPSGIGAVVAHGHTVGVDLALSLDVLWSQTRRAHRQQIAHSLRAGHKAGWDLTWTHFETFKRMYAESMMRVSADDSYHFNDAYFDGLRDALGTRLHLSVVEIDGALAAAGLFVETCGIVQYHLSAANQRFTRFAPTKVMLHFVRTWAKERGDRWLHLGGGVGGAEDSLLGFKAGFSPRLLPFHTLRLVILEEDYVRLVARHNRSADPTKMDGYFPVYRDLEPRPRMALPDTKSSSVATSDRASRTHP